jgi:hypothetical protein
LGASYTPCQLSQCPKDGVKEQQRQRCSIQHTTNALPEQDDCHVQNQMRNNGTM